MREQEERPKRNPYCSRCRNHGKSAQVKGHKRHCEYRYCQCEGCKLVECRQIVSAAQIKRRRYQKQDEECGRRIEVSPPVLTKTANNSDPAALIAKTLIGSNKSCTIAAPDSSGVGVGSSKLIDVGGVGGTGAPPIAQANRLQNQLQEHMMGLPAFQSASGTTSFRDAQQLFQFTTAFSQQQQQQQQHANPSNLLISAGASLGPTPIVPTSTTTLLTGSPVATGIREQLNLVEEIHRNFGPLAIFAWLRSEDFDMAKIRTLIEMSRVSYEEMLQMNVTLASSTIGMGSCWRSYRDSYKY